MSRSEELKKVIALCDYITTAEETIAARSFDFALFGYALCKLDEYLGEDRYYMFLKSFCDGYACNPQVLTAANDAAPAIVLNEMHKKTGAEEYAAPVKAALEFLESRQRIQGLPYRFNGVFRSVQTETLISDLLVRYLCGENRQGLSELPALYAECLMDKNDKLFYRSYMPETRMRLPIGRNYPARDNALALFALSLLAEGEGYSDEGLNKLIAGLTQSILKYQNADGTYGGFLKNKRKSEAHDFLTDGKKTALMRTAENAVNIFSKNKKNGEGRDIDPRFGVKLSNQGGDIDPRFGVKSSNQGGDIDPRFDVDSNRQGGGIDPSKTPAYGESPSERLSGSGGGSQDPAIAAYYAACCIKNASAGIVDEGYIKIGERAFFSGLNSLTNEGGAIYLPDVTKKSFVQSIMPGLFLKLNPRTRNNPYGVAGLVFAAITADGYRLKNQKAKT
ncbi:MAG: hypothetical protein LBQ40_06360 [Clostridiales bacterium]|jgi:hypothetical protein|nr:hypothetical protein [Clostridiales bacterium]